MCFAGFQPVFPVSFRFQLIILFFIFFMFLIFFYVSHVVFTFFFVAHPIFWRGSGDQVGASTWLSYSFPFSCVFLSVCDPLAGHQNQKETRTRTQTSSETMGPKKRYAPKAAGASHAKKMRNPAGGEGKEPSAAEMMGSGAEISVEKYGRKTPQQGDRGTNALVTWSHPRKRSCYKSPQTFTRQEFAAALGNCWDEICAEHHAKGPKPIPAVAVFRERHTSGDIHYHAVMSAPRNSLWYHVEAKLRSKYAVHKAKSLEKPYCVEVL